MSYMQAKEPECDSRHCPEDVSIVITPRVVDLGGFEVRRALPSPEKCMVGPFVFWDQAGPSTFVMDTGIDVRPHPHIGLSTLTYLIEGNLEHKDSLGNRQIIKPGDVNLMTAGKGIAHSERTPQADRKHTRQFFGIQCWLALPKKSEEMDPGFAHYAADRLPFIEDNGLSLRLVAGEYEGLNSPVKTVSSTLFMDCILSPRRTLNIPADTEERAVYILVGSVQLDKKLYYHGQMLLLKPGHHVSVTAAEHAHIIVLGGAVLDGNRHVWWNFVSSSKERIEQAKKDWVDGKFAKIPGDDKEFIPLPT